MKKTKIMYLRHLIKARKWSNTEKGERTICTIGAIWSALAFISFALLVAGMLEPQMGMQRAISFVAA